MRSPHAAIRYASLSLLLAAAGCAGSGLFASAGDWRDYRATRPAASPRYRTRSSTRRASLPTT